MDNRTVVDRIMRNLDFDLETVPKHKAAIETRTSTSKNDPLNVKIKVRKKDFVDESSNQGFISNNLSEPEMVLQKVRLVNSDETIMTFDMLMEAEFDKKTSPKPRKMFAKLKPGLCLGATDDDDGPYMPDDSSVSKSDRILRQQFTLAKNKYETFGDSTLTRETSFLGRKCKPGGCLDPPFGEDRYSYMPRIEEPLKYDTKNLLRTNEAHMDDQLDNKQAAKRPVKEDNMKKDIKQPSVESGSLLSLYKIASPKNSILTYPHDNESKLSTRKPSEDKHSKRKNSSQDKSRYLPGDESKVLETKLPSEDNENKVNKSRPTSEDKSRYPIEFGSKALRTRVASESNDSKFYNKRPSNENKYRQSVNESMNDFFSPPKDIKREPVQPDLLKRHSNIPSIKNKPIEYLRTPIPVSVSLDSVPLNQNHTSSELIDDTHLKDNKLSENIKSLPDQNSDNQKQIELLVVPLPIPIHFPVNANQNDASAVSSSSHSPNGYPKENSIESVPLPIPIHFPVNANQNDASAVSSSSHSPNGYPKENSIESKVTNSSIISNLLQNNFTPKENKVNDEGSVTSALLQVDLESITKKVNTTSFEEFPSISKQTNNINGYKNSEQLVSESDNKMQELQQNDTIRKQSHQDPLKTLDLDYKQIMEKDSPNNNDKKIIIINNSDKSIGADIKSDILRQTKSESLTNSLQDITENIKSSADLDIRLLDANITKFPTEHRISTDKTDEILKKSNIASDFEPTILNAIKQDSDENTENIYLATKSHNTSLDINKLYEETNLTEQVRMNRNESLRQSNNGSNSPANKITMRGVVISGNDDDDTLKAFRNNSDTYNTHALTSTPYVKYTKNKNGVLPDIPKRPTTPLVTKTNEPNTSVQGCTKLGANDDQNNNIKSKIIPSTNISNNDVSTVSLDLAFHSYLNNRNERILSTVDARYDVRRYPNDSILLINTQVNLSSNENDHGLVIPIDSKHDMSIELKKKSNNIKFNDSNKTETKPISILLRSDANSLKSKGDIKESRPKLHNKANENEKVCNTLTDIYEQQLVPLQTMIRNLKQEIDGLVAQQTVYKKKVICIKGTKIPQIIHSNKRCSS